MESFHMEFPWELLFLCDFKAEDKFYTSPRKATTHIQTLTLLAEGISRALCSRKTGPVSVLQAAVS